MPSPALPKTGSDDALLEAGQPPAAVEQVEILVKEAIEAGGADLIIPEPAQTLGGKNLLTTNGVKQHHQVKPHNNGAHPHPRHQLSLIPEDDRPVTQRFEFVIVARDGREFVEKILDSAMAETYKPRHSVKSQDSDDPCSPKDSNEDRDRYVLYCPANFASRDLVRIRFKMCTTFSDDLPLMHEKLGAMGQMVVLLLWKGPQWTPESSVADVIKDWRSRIAELMHHPANFRPQVVVLAIACDKEERAQVNQFVDQQTNLRVTASFFDEDHEGALADAMQCLSETIVRAQGMRNSRFSINRIQSKRAQQEQDDDSPAACCVIS